MQQMGSNKYVRVCPAKKSYGKLYPADKWHEAINNNNKDWYRSVALYTQEEYDKFQKVGSVAGWTGTTSNFFIFDFDAEDELDLARKDALTLISRLSAYGINPDTINLTFSGNKGFGVEFFLGTEYNCRQLQAAATKLAGDLKTWDASMYDEPQLIRVPGTKHDTSGLFKTILTAEQLRTLTLPQIKELAKTLPAEINWTEEPNTLPGELFIDNTPKVTPKIITGGIDFSKRPHDMPKWKYCIMHGLFPPGRAHDCLLALAAHFRGLGYPEGATLSVCEEASRLQYERCKAEYGVNDPTEERNAPRLVQNVYGPSWKGGTFEGNDELKNLICPDESVGSTEKTVLTIKDMSTKFNDFARNIKTNRIYTGIPELDKKVIMTTGISVGILAGPGAGKTSLALNFLNSTSSAGISSMFFSLDMSQNMLYAKLISREHNVPFEEVIESFEQNKPCVQQWMQELSSSFKNVGFFFKTGTSVDGIRAQIMRHSADTGEKVKFVIIDYLEMLTGPHADATANSANHAAKLSDLAKDLDLCVMVLVQPPKSAGGAGKPLTSMQQIKGSSMLEQNFRVILGVYREGFHPDYPDDDNFITIKGLKNTFGPLFSVDMGWEGVRGRIYPLNSDGKAQLTKLRERKAAQEAAKNSGGVWVGGSGKGEGNF